ncbi:MAG: putative ABC transporter permease, partial [Traorella sp.]
MKLIEIFLYLMIYSCLGWICESIFVSIGRKEWVNSGFFYGPYCPIYGFGAVFVLYLLKPFIDYPVLVFLFGVLITSTLEYFTSWLLEKLFHILWWDYSKEKFNINGRVCLLNSTLFGLMALVVTYGIHPIVVYLIQRLSSQVQYVLSSILFVIIAVDFFFSVKNLISFKQSIVLFETKLEKIKEKLSAQLPDVHLDVKEKIEDFFEQHEFSDISHHLQLHYESLRNNR